MVAVLFRKKGRGRGPGFAAFRAAELAETPWPRFRDAIDACNIPSVPYGKEKRITMKAINDWRALFGKPPLAEVRGADGVEVVVLADQVETFQAEVSTALKAEMPTPDL